MLSLRSGNQLHCCSSSRFTIENQIYFIFLYSLYIGNVWRYDFYLFAQIYIYFLILFFFPLRHGVALHLENNNSEANVKHAGQQATECVCLIEVSRFNDLNVCSFTVRGSGDRILIMKFCDCISLGKLGFIIIIITFR